MTQMTLLCFMTATPAAQVLGELPGEKQERKEKSCFSAIIKRASTGSSLQLFPGAK